MLCECVLACLGVPSDIIRDEITSNTTCFPPHLSPDGSPTIVYAASEMSGATAAGRRVRSCRPFCGCSASDESCGPDNKADQRGIMATVCGS